jgi:hypothetical protein
MLLHSKSLITSEEKEEREREREEKLSRLLTITILPRQLISSYLADEFLRLNSSVFS